VLAGIPSQARNQSRTSSSTWAAPADSSHAPQYRLAAAAVSSASAAGQVVKLAEGPGKGGLPALVGSGDDEDPLGPGQGELVGDHRLALGHELVRQGQVEGVGGVDFLRAGANLGIAELQPGEAKRLGVVQVGQIELEFPVDAPDSLVEERGVLAAVLVQGGELLREQPGHQFEDLGAPKDPRTGKRIGTYGIYSDADNNLYLLDFSAGNIVRIDAKTKEPTVFLTPTPNSHPRRGRVDDQGRLWFAEYFGNAIGMLDPETGKISEWKVPTPWSARFSRRREPLAT